MEVKDEKRLYAVVRSRGPAWDDSVRLEQQPGWDAHAVFMEDLVDDGFVVLGGPLDGTRDVLLVVRATSATEIGERLAADPWSQSGQLIVKQTTPWQIRLGSPP
jgi:hypothetical protein